MTAESYTTSHPIGSDGYWLFFKMAGLYAGTIVGAGILQPIVPAFFQLILLGPFWIGAIIHVFMLHVAIAASFANVLPRPLLIVPALFYGAGLGVGLYSDMMAWRWASGQQWVQIDKPVPADVQYVAFDLWSMLGERKRDDRAGTLRPEKFGFELARIFLRKGAVQRSDERLVPYSTTGPACPDIIARGISVIGDRCFKSEPIARPSAFVIVGNIANQERTGPAPDYNWGTVLPLSQPIVLHQNGWQEVVGRIGGAFIRKLGYVLIPTWGCAPESMDPRPKSKCEGILMLNWRSQSVGFEPSVLGQGSPDTIRLLMLALEHLRDRQRPASPAPDQPAR